MSISDPTIGEITMFAGNFAPKNWALCNGDLISISDNQALFSIVGTTYGGDGRTNFKLPDLRGRFAKHAGSGPGLTSVTLGQKGGGNTQTLTEAQMPAHTHDVKSHCEGKIGNTQAPKNNMLGVGSATNKIYVAPDPAPNVTMASEAITEQSKGSNQAFNIDNPYQAVNFIIALQGTYPSRN